MENKTIPFYSQTNDNIQNVKCKKKPINLAPHKWRKVLQDLPLSLSIPKFHPHPWREGIKGRGNTPTLILPLKGEEFVGDLRS